MRPPTRSVHPSDDLGTRLAPAFFAALLAAACSQPEREPYYDLVARFGQAEVGVSSPADELLPLADDAASVLFLPVGARVSYAFRGRPESALQAERLIVRGKATELQLRLETDSMEPVSARAARSKANWAWKLSLDRPQAARVTFEVTSAEPAPGDGVALRHPAIWGAATEPEAAAPTVDPISASARPNVIIYLIDTLRRDRLGSYGYHRPVSPHIDELAQTATVFENSIGQSSWTKPSVASLFTGVWPPAHTATGWEHRLPDEFETLAERLAAAGYRTAAFVTNVNASPHFGLRQGFDYLWYERKALATRVNEKVFSWLDAFDGSAPIFLYIHTMEPHAGYQPGEPFLSRFAPTAGEMPELKSRWKWPAEARPYLSDLYDGEIAQNDDAFGRLVKRLRADDLFSNSLLIVVADHGEEFLEHQGWRHGRVLFAETLNVPLIVKFPGQTHPARSAILASHVDVLPTVMDVVGLEAAPELDGRSLRRPGDRPVFSHLQLPRHPLQYSVVFEGWKLIQTHRAEVGHQLFDVETDPGETRDLAAERPVTTAWLAGLLRERLATSLGVKEESVVLTDELRDSLRALGYLE